MDPDKLIENELGYDILGRVRSQAFRSTIQSYKTGAVVFNDRNLNVISSGTSHIPYEFTVGEKRSVHAEDHALNKISYIKDKSNLSIVIYTLNWSGANHTTSSRPCPPCAQRLMRAGLRHIYYCERDNVGGWHLNCLSPECLID